MANKPSRSGKKWTAQELQTLRKLAKQNTPTRIIGLKMDRTPDAIYKKASERKIPLKPTNQSPYNRRKK